MVTFTLVGRDGRYDVRSRLFFGMPVRLETYITDALAEAMRFGCALEVQRHGTHG